MSASIVPGNPAAPTNFDVPVRYHHDDLRRFVEAVLGPFGLSPTAAARSARFLLVADPRGVESHGIARLPYYASRFQWGLVNVDAHLRVVRESAATLSLDAQTGFGLDLAHQAMEACIAKAETSGLCFATVRASNHFGIAGAYALMAAQRGLAGIAMTNSSPLVVPTFGKTAMLGTNPIAFAVPRSLHGEPPPLGVDLATSTVAWGRIEVARRANQPVPLGWALDEAAMPTTDPHAARYLTPLGANVCSAVTRATPSRRWSMCSVVRSEALPGAPGSPAPAEQT